jgi:DNA-binding PadR family transcriptional regulator
MIDFIDLVILVNAKSFVSIYEILKKFKFRKYTVEAVRKRLEKLCSQGLMEAKLSNRIKFYRTTEKGYEAVMEFCKVQEIDALFEALKSWCEVKKTSP